MTSPDLELQGAVRAALIADSAVTALIGTSIYDEPPESPDFDYVTFGPSDVVQLDADCPDALTITFQIDAWSDGPGFPKVKALAWAVREALDGATLTLSGFGFLEVTHRITRVMRDPQPKIRHAAITFVALVDVP